MMTMWRAAGVDYIRFSAIAAALVRQALKPELRKAAAARDRSTLKITPWEAGKPQLDKKY